MAVLCGCPGGLVCANEGVKDLQISDTCIWSLFGGDNHLEDLSNLVVIMLKF